MPHNRTKKTIITSIFVHQKEILLITQKIIKVQEFIERDINILIVDNSPEIKNSLQKHQNKIDHLVARIRVIHGFINLDIRLLTDLINDTCA